MLKDQQNFYWLFSSTAQVVSVFVAFLLTGYAIVLNVMSELQQKDDSLEEIHGQLKKNYYRMIIVISIATGLAIAFSLWMVYLNGQESNYKALLYSVTLLLDAFVVGSGITFVIRIINPNRYKIAARTLLNEEKKEFPTSGVEESENNFTHEFTRLEKSISDVISKKQLYVRPERGPKMGLPYREMTQALYENRLITMSTYQDLVRIYRYRNLIFHGREDKVDKRMVDLVTKVRGVVDNIK